MIVPRKNASSFVRFLHQGSNLKPFESIPGPRPLPLIGNIWRYLPIIGQYSIFDLAGNAQKFKQKYGNIVREKIHSKTTVLYLYDANDVEALFRQDDRYPSRKSFIAMKKYRLDRPDKYVNGGIVPENGEPWIRNRNLFQERMLSKSKVSQYAGKIDGHTLSTLSDLDKLIDARNEIKIENFQEILSRWALRCVTSLFLDCDLDTIDKDEVSQLLKSIDDTLIGTHATDMISTKWQTKPDECKYYQKLVNAQDFLYDFSRRQIDKIVGEGQTDRHSMVHDWLYEDKIDRKDINGFVMDAFSAGVHSTAYTLTYLIYHLKNHAENQKIIEDEINKANLKNIRNATADDIGKITHLNHCLQETLRMHPISTGTGRLTSSDIELHGYHIPKNTMVVVQNEVISRDDRYFENPDQFSPQRWKNYRACPKDQRPSAFACRPFGLGARSCIGQRIIDLEMRIMMARLLQKYEIVDTTVPKRKTMTVHVLDGNFGVTLKVRPQ